MLGKSKCNYVNKKYIVREGNTQRQRNSHAYFSTTLRAWLLEFLRVDFLAEYKNPSLNF